MRTHSPNTYGSPFKVLQRMSYLRRIAMFACAAFSLTCQEQPMGDDPMLDIGACQSLLCYLRAAETISIENFPWLCYGDAPVALVSPRFPNSLPERYGRHPRCAILHPRLDRSRGTFGLRVVKFSFLAALARFVGFPFAMEGIRQRRSQLHFETSLLLRKKSLSSSAEVLNLKLGPAVIFQPEPLLAWKLESDGWTGRQPSLIVSRCRLNPLLFATDTGH
eukprot:3057376-Rhodomonas_salina.2